MGIKLSVRIKYLLPTQVTYELCYDWNIVPGLVDLFRT